MHRHDRDDGRVDRHVFGARRIVRTAGDARTLVRGLRADGVGAIIGGCFNPFPYTSFSQNVGLIGMTGVRSRWAVATSGVILIVLGLFPKLATVVASIPAAVLGGAGIAMFGMVAATGIKILSGARLSERHNLLVVAVSVGIGMIPLVSPTMFAQLPNWTAPFAHSGITLAAFTAVLLNALFNGNGEAEPARHAVVPSVSGEIVERAAV